MAYRRTWRIAILCLLAGAGAGAASLGYAGCNGDRSNRPSLTLPPDRVVLLITGYTNGNLEPCNCPGQPRGGLSRRKTLLDSLRGQCGPAVLLDNGNSVLLTPEPVTDRYIWAGMARLGYDAMAVGDQELDRGPKEFADAARQANLPLVATNVRFIDGRPIGPAYRRIDTAGKSVVVLSVIGPRMMQFSSAQVRQEIEIADPVESVRRTLAQLRAEPKTRPPDVVVLLAVLDPGEREGIVSRLAGVDLAVLSTEQDRPVEAETIGRTPVIFAPALGRRIAAVVFAPTTFSLPPGGRAGERGPAGATSRPMHIVQVTAHAVEQTLPRDKAMWDLYQAYTYDAQQWRLLLLEKAGAVKFVSSAQCGQCHVVQYQWWLKHKHGHAWATIVREGRTSDPDCMRCHTTGYGYVGGYHSLPPPRGEGRGEGLQLLPPPSGEGRREGKPLTAAGTPGLENVGCQSCHQVDPAPHLAAPAPKRAPRVEEMTCRGCHSAATSPNFDMDLYAPKATCPKGKAVLPGKG